MLGKKFNLTNVYILFPGWDGADEKAPFLRNEPVKLTPAWEGANLPNDTLNLKGNLTSDTFSNQFQMRALNDTDYTHLGEDVYYFDLTATSLAYMIINGI